MKRYTQRKKYYLATLTRVAFFLVFCLLLPVFVYFSDLLTERAFANENGWVKIGGFTTWFSKNDGGRCENIAIAARLIDGVTVQAYGEFSFNQTVGARTAQNGFKQAKIIVKGEYVKGIGGGVCQVSTTLYNALLLSGLEVTEFHPHSLAVSYVEPSRDAMVSSSSDLKFFNPYPFAVRLNLTVKDGGITVAVFGADKKGKGGFSYKIVTNVLNEIPPPEPIERQGEKDEVLQYAKNGIESESYLEIYQKGALITKKRLRKDAYAPVREIIVKKNEDTTKKMPSNVCVFLRKML